MLKVAKTIDRKNNIDIALESGPVEICRHMRHDYIFAGNITRNDTVIKLAKLKRCVAVAMQQSGRGNDRNAPLDQCWSADKRLAVEWYAYFVTRVLRINRRHVVQAYHISLDVLDLRCEN